MRLIYLEPVSRSVPLLEATVGACRADVGKSFIGESFTSRRDDAIARMADFSNLPMREVWLSPLGEQQRDRASTKHDPAREYGKNHKHEPAPA